MKHMVDKSEVNEPLVYVRPTLIAILSKKADGKSSTSTYESTYTSGSVVYSFGS